MRSLWGRRFAALILPAVLAVGWPVVADAANIDIKISVDNVLVTATDERKITISPDGDGKNDEAVIEFTLPEAGKVRVRIYQMIKSSNGDVDYILVRNLVSLQEADQPAGIQRLIWNGNNDSGKIVQNGDYQVRVSLTTNREEHRGRSAPLTVEVVPVVTDLKFTPDPFTPGRQKAGIEYRLTKAANIVIQIAGPEGVVFTRKQRNVQPGGKFVDWNGTNERTGAVIRTGGEYRVVLGYQTQDGKIDKISTSFNVTSALDVSVISATPRVFDPSDKGGSFATIISFRAEKPDVDFSVKIQNQSGRTVWEQTFNYPQGGSAKRKEFTWGGLRSYELHPTYVIQRSQKTVLGKDNVVEQEKAETVIGETIKLRSADIRYDGRGRTDIDTHRSRLNAQNRLLRVGEQYQYRGAWWTIRQVKLKVNKQHLPNGEYSVRIKVKDRNSQKVSNEFGTTVAILSRKIFKLCVSGVTTRDDLSSDEAPSERSSRGGFASEVDTNWCDGDDRPPIDFRLRGGVLFVGDRNNVDVFDPLALKWFNADKVKGYWDFQSDMVRVKFQVTKDSRLEARVRSSKGGVVRELPGKPSHLATDEENAYFSWDGTDEDGETVPSGRYYFEISATDADPTAPKTITTAAVVDLRDITNFVRLDRENSEFKEVPSRAEGKVKVLDYFAFPPVQPFSSVSTSKDDIDDLLGKAKASKVEKSAEREGIYKLAYSNNRGEGFLVDYLFTALVDTGTSQEGSDARAFEVQLLSGCKRASSDFGDINRSLLSGGFPDINAIGVTDLWVFIRKREEQNKCGTLDNNNWQCGSVKWQTEGRSRHSGGALLKNCPGVTVKHYRIRGLAHLTEAGLHLKKVLGEGFQTVAETRR